MDLFNWKKVRALTRENLDLKYENTCLKDRIADLETIIENKGYKIPETEKTKKLIFEDVEKWLTTTHFSEIMNTMNAKNFEIVSFKSPSQLENLNYGFEIEYRLPPGIISADFNFANEFKKGGTSYVAKFKFETTK